MIVSVVAALTAPLVWAVLAHPGSAIGDIALMELRTRDVFSAHPPLVGAYSRYGWNHPGPLVFYLFALPYRLLGNDADALRIAALLLNTATLVVLAWVVRRRGTAVLVLLMASACALAWGLPPTALADSWNVTIDLLPFMLTIVACWCALCDDRWAWLVAAIGFSFVFQTHVGFGVVLAPLFLATAVWLVVEGRRRDGETRGRDIAIGIAAGLVVALPALYDAVVHWPGNLGDLAEWSVTNSEPTVGLADGLRVIGRTSSLSFPLHARFPNQFVVSIGSISTGVAPGSLLVLLAVAAVFAIRRRWRAEGVLCGCLALVWISGTFAAANVTRPLEFWLIEWLQPLAWLTWAAVALVAWRLLQPAVQRWLSAAHVRTATAVVAAGALAIGTVAYTRGAASAHEGDTYTGPIDELTRAAATLGAEQPLYFGYDGDPFSAGTMFLAVANELDKAGFAICVDAAFANQFGSARVCSGRPDVRLFIRNEPTALPPPPGATTLTISDPLSPAERIEADDLTAQLTEVLVRNGLEADVPLLYTPLADLLVDRSPPSEVEALRADILRLSELRRAPGTRFGLYAVGDGG